MLKAERQRSIVEVVLAQGTMTVSELSDLFEVSDITIRRDLDELDENGYLQRVRGGVRRPSPKGPEPPSRQRQKENAAEKKSIAQAAMKLITEDDVIALQMGTTVLELAKALARKTWQNLQVVTNGIPIITELARTPGVRLICVGGMFDPDELACSGYHAQQFLTNFNISKLFLGCRGIDAERGVTNAMQAENELGTIHAFVRSASRVIVVADHSKFNQVFPMQTLPLSAIDTIVTDSDVSEHTLKKMHDQGIYTVVA